MVKLIRDLKFLLCSIRSKTLPLQDVAYKYLKRTMGMLTLVMRLVKALKFFFLFFIRSKNLLHDLTYGGFEAGSVVPKTFLMKDLEIARFCFFGGWLCG